MRRYDWKLTRDDGELVLATAEEAVDGLDMSIADFRDTHALYYVPLRAWVGISRAGVELGTAAPRMERGIWYVARDEAVCAANRDINPAPGELVLRRIP